MCTFKGCVLVEEIENRERNNLSFSQIVESVKERIVEKDYILFCDHLVWKVKQEGADPLALKLNQVRETIYNDHEFMEMIGNRHPADHHEWATTSHKFRVSLLDPHVSKEKLTLLAIAKETQYKGGLNHPNPNLWHVDLTKRGSRLIYSYKERDSSFFMVKMLKQELEEIKKR